ncbi:MAG: exopolysaccharide biosynthesis protein [Pirellulaceae bacterium]
MIKPPKIQLGEDAPPIDFESNPDVSPPESLSEVLDALVENTDGRRVSVGDLLNTFESRSYGPLLLVPAVLAISPAGFIPGMSLVTGPIIFLFSAEMIFSKSGPWLPAKLRSFSLSRKILVRAVEKSKPWAMWIDKGFRHRLTPLTRPPLSYLMAVLCMMLGVTMYPLAFVPFGVWAPGLAVVFFALGLTSRDGLLILVGYGLTGLAVGLVIWIFL